MARRQRQELSLTTLQGRDGYGTSTVEIPTTRARECLNVDGEGTTFVRKRRGCTTFATSTNFTTTIKSMFVLPQTPASIEDQADVLVCVDASSPPRIKRLTPTENPADPEDRWTAITLKYALQDANYVRGVTVNGKTFILGDTATDRAQLYDCDEVLYRAAGLGTPAAPTVGNTGSGSYAAVTRYYKVAYTFQSSGDTIRRSELSAASSPFTPSGTGTAAQVTKPTGITEGETHWELYGAAASAGPYYLIATTAVGTTTYDDTATYASPASYTTGAAAPLAGQNTPAYSFKYGIGHEGRVLFAGRWEGTDNFYKSRVYFTRPKFATSTRFADDEVIDVDDHIDLDEKDGGQIVGFAVLENMVFVFKNAQIWRLTATGNTDAPYRRRLVSGTIGAISQESIVVGELAGGEPAIYFWVPLRGPHRYSISRGIEFIGRDIQDITDAIYPAQYETNNMNICAVWYDGRKQVWWWYPDASWFTNVIKVVFDVRRSVVTDTGDVRGGWYKHTGRSATASCAAMFQPSRTPTRRATNKPYIATASDTSKLYICDNNTSTAEDGTVNYQAYVEYPPMHLGGIAHRHRVADPVITGKAGSHTLRMTLVRDYGFESRTADTVMTASGSETRVTKRVEAGFTSDASAIAITVGDSAANTALWELDAIVVPFETREEI